MSTARYAHTATWLGSGQVLVAGGSDGAVALASAELYTPVRSSCTLASDCVSGFCADGVCCDTACNAGACDACSIAAGAATDGTCALLTGSACDDGNACTQIDTCQSGMCTGSNMIACPPPGECEGALCNPTNGACLSFQKLDYAPCLGGICIAGGCFIDATTSSASGSSSGTGAGSSSSGGATGSGGATSTSTSTSTSASSGMSTNAGAGGAAEITFHGGACGVGRGAAEGATWIGLGLLLALRRRQQRCSAAR